MYGKTGAGMSTPDPAMTPDLSTERSLMRKIVTPIDAKTPNVCLLAYGTLTHNPAVVHDTDGQGDCRCVTIQVNIVVPPKIPWMPMPLTTTKPLYDEVAFRYRFEAIHPHPGQAAAAIARHATYLPARYRRTWFGALRSWVTTLFCTLRNFRRNSNGKKSTSRTTGTGIEGGNPSRPGQ